MTKLLLTLVLFTLLPLFACTQQRDASAERFQWSIAIHGGAGTLDKSSPPEKVAEYKESLRIALEEGRRRLAAGENAMDVCEAVVRILEDDPHFNAGKGAAFNERGQHELDASIMDGSTLKCGAVAAVRTVKNPISLARKVMENTRHVLLMGDGAEEFATAMNVERVPNSYFDTEHRRKALEKRLEELKNKTSSIERPGDKSTRFSTVGCVVLDNQGRLAAATSTGGLTAKKFGRIGDSPIIGAGNYADTYCAVSGTGTGEEFIRHGVARAVSARMQFAGESVHQAAHALVFNTLKPDDGGVIAIDSRGHVAMPYNTEGMYRGTANSAGRFEVHVFED